MSLALQLRHKEHWLDRLEAEWNRTTTTHRKGHQLTYSPDGGVTWADRPRRVSTPTVRTCHIYETVTLTLLPPLITRYTIVCAPKPPVILVHRRIYPCARYVHPRTVPTSPHL